MQARYMSQQRISRLPQYEKTFAILRNSKQYRKQSGPARVQSQFIQTNAGISSCSQQQTIVHEPTRLTKPLSSSRQFLGAGCLLILHSWRLPQFTRTSVYMIVLVVTTKLAPKCGLGGLTRT